MADEEDEEMSESEEIAFGLISTAGTARSLYMNAMKAARAGNFDEADDLMKQAEEPSLEAHNTQTKLLVSEAQGHHIPVDVLLVHSQDHLMDSIAVGDLAVEIIALYKKLAELEAKVNA